MTPSNSSCWNGRATPNARPIGPCPESVVRRSPPYGVRDAAACPQAPGPHPRFGQCTRAPLVLLARSAGYATHGQSIRVGFVSSRYPIGASAARAAAVILPGAGGSSRLSSICVSAVPVAVASWGVVRPGGRRLRACRCSRGRRPSGSDSEAMDPLAAPLQRHRSGVGGRLTRTRLRPACRLQRPCSLPRCLC